MKLSTTKDSRLDIKSVHYRLMVAWFCGATPLYIHVMAKAFSNQYGGRAEDAAGWVLSTTMPTLLLILGVVAAESVQAKSAQAKSAQSEGETAEPSDRKPPPSHLSGATVDRRFFRFTLALSIFYLLLINLMPFLEYIGPTPAVFLTSTNLFISPIQGLNSAALGVLFISRERG